MRVFRGRPRVVRRRWAMSESRRRIVKFLEKEIKTYKALSLFLSKKDIKEHIRKEPKKVLISPTFYKERIKEAKKLVFELRKPD
jgi:ribosome recycling factor